MPTSQTANRLEAIEDALDRLSLAERCIYAALSVEARADRQAEWRTAYFQALRLMKPGQSYGYYGNVVSRVDDRLLYSPFNLRERRAS